MSEAFSVKKFFDFGLLTWLKAFKFGLILAGVAFIGITIWRAYFMPTNTQSQETAIRVERGGTLNLTQSQKQEIKKKKWWVPSIFGEVYGFTETDGRMGLGAKGGLRWEI